MKDKGYNIKAYDGPVKRYCQTMDLKNNPDLIAMYKKCHSQTEDWTGFNECIRSVGILEMEIYIAGSRLFMIVETPLDFDWKTAMDKLSHLPRQAEWENYVSRFQECVAESTSAEKWKLMERMFYLYE